MSKGLNASRLEGNVAAAQRLEWLTKRLNGTGAVTIAEAAAALAVSEMTIRRDLLELEERGAARRVRGGAMPARPQSFAERHERGVRAKAQIAVKLAHLVAVEGAVAFDASSTVLRLAAKLSTARNLTVVTNGPETFNALQAQRGIVPIITGGQMESRTGSLVGPIACRSASQFTFDQFITSAAALDADAGATEATLEEAEVKRAMAAGARQVILAVDSTKLEQRAFVAALSWEQIDAPVTELGPADERLAPYRALSQIV